MKMQEIYKQEMNKKLQEPSSNGMTSRERRNDGFQNKELRCLTVAAFLNCIYASIEYAPTV